MCTQDMMPNFVKLSNELEFRLFQCSCFHIFVSGLQRNMSIILMVFKQIDRMDQSIPDQFKYRCVSRFQYGVHFIALLSYQNCISTWAILFCIYRNYHSSFHINLICLRQLRDQQPLLKHSKYE